jgi:hypothetical protein
MGLRVEIAHGYSVVWWLVVQWCRKKTVSEKKKSSEAKTKEGRRSAGAMVK